MRMWGMAIEIIYVCSKCGEILKNGEQMEKHKDGNDDHFYYYMEEGKSPTKNKYSS